MEMSFKPRYKKAEEAEKRIVMYDNPFQDVVPVVRCKDCKWHEGGNYCVSLDVLGILGEDFCSWGERKDD